MSTIQNSDPPDALNTRHIDESAGDISENLETSRFSSTLETQI